MRVRSKVILGVTAALVIAATGTVFWYVRSGRLQEFARVDLISRVQKATGMVCTVGRLELAPLRGEFRLTGITLGPITDGAGPLTASIDEVKGRVSLSSIWHLSLHLAELNVLRPRVTLTSTQGGGGWDPENVLKSLRTSLDLAAGSILLTDGWVQLDNTHIPLNLSLNDVICEIHYVADHPHYCIRLAYKNSRLLYEGRDIKYNLDTRINLSMEGVEVGSFRLEHGKSLLSGNGWVRGWKAPVLLLHAAGILDGTDLALFSSDLREARGSFHVATNLRVDSGGLRLDGKFDLQSGGFRRASLSSLRGLFEIRKDVLYLNAVDGKLGAGAIHADGEIQLREGNKPPNRVLISTRDVCLREVSYVLNLSEIDFLNTADSTAEVIWKHGNEDLDLTVQAGLKAPPSSSLEPGRSTPLQGDLAFSYRRGVWYFTSANLNSAQTAVAIAGQGGTTFHIQAHTSRVAEPLSVLRGFVPSLERLLSRQPDLIEVSGTYGLNGNMLMEPERTVYQGALTIKDGQWHTHRVDSLASKALWEGSHLELHEMNLHKGAESAAGDLTLEIPSEEGESLGMTFQGKAGNVSLPSLRELGVEMSPDIGGTLSGSGRISNADGTWAGDAQFLLENGSYKGEPFDSIHGKFKTRNKILQIADCQIARGAAKVAAHGQIQLDTNQMELTLGLAGLSLEEIPEIQDKNPEVEGRISGAGELRGDIDNPRFKGNLDLTGLRYASWDLGSGKGTLDLEDRILRANVNVQSSLGKLGAQARIS
ncbi:MAG TPA: hypothetical protein VE398_19590, partial [Acidobacteriota bacterium]|nr:hypothetical protein [Acidobacteriota bacterium]